MPVEVDERCSGCSACAYVCPIKCIEMYDNREGFSFPRIDIDVCIHCGRCEKACPLNVNNTIVPQTAISFCTDNGTTLNQCASGGAFTTLARKFIECGDIAVGVSDDVHRGSHFVLVESAGELKKVSGSKYYQCNLGTETLSLLVDVLKGGRKVLFGGTPCQVQAIKNVVAPSLQENLYLIDLVCQGVPSRESIRQFRLETEKAAGRKLVKHLFRMKAVGHEGSYVTCLEFDNGVKRTHIDGEDICTRVFMYQVSLRESCYVCPFAQKERVGDLSLGDYWSSQLDGSFVRGSTSLILINTDKGQELKQLLIGTGTTVPVSVSQAIAGNVPLHHPIHRPFERNYFYYLLDCLGFKRAAEICTWRYIPRRILEHIVK